MYAKDIKSTSNPWLSFSDSIIKQKTNDSAIIDIFVFYHQTRLYTLIATVVYYNLL